MSSNQIRFSTLRDTFGDENPVKLSSYFSDGILASGLSNVPQSYSRISVGTIRYKQPHPYTPLITSMRTNNTRYFLTGLCITKNNEFIQSIRNESTRSPVAYYINDNVNANPIITINNTSSVLKFSSNGSLMWNAEIETTTGQFFCATESVVSTDNGDIYVCGYAGSTFSSSPEIVNFYNGNGTLQSSLSLSNRQIFLVKYNRLGFVQWITTMGGDGNNEAMSLATLDGKSVVIAFGTKGENAQIKDAQGTINYLPDTTIAQVVVANFDENGLLNANGGKGWIARFVPNLFTEFDNMKVRTSERYIYVVMKSNNNSITIYNSDNTSVTVPTPPGSGQPWMIARLTKQGVLSYVNSLTPTIYHIRTSSGYPVESLGVNKNTDDICIATLAYGFTVQITSPFQTYSLTAPNTGWDDISVFATFKSNGEKISQWIVSSYYHFCEEVININNNWLFQGWRSDVINIFDNNGTLIKSENKLPNSIDGDVFLIRMSSQGDLIWDNHFGGGSRTTMYISDNGIIKAGKNIYIGFYHITDVNQNTSNLYYKDSIGSISILNTSSNTDRELASYTIRLRDNGTI